MTPKERKEWREKVYSRSVKLIDELIKEGYISNDAPYYIIQNRCMEIAQKHLRKLK